MPILHAMMYKAVFLSIIISSVYSYTMEDLKVFETVSKKVIKPKLLAKKEIRQKEISKAIEFYKNSSYHSFVKPKSFQTQ